MIAIIGSTAFKILGYTDKNPNDLDIIGDYDSVIAYSKTKGEMTACYPIESGKKYFIKSSNGSHPTSNDGLLNDYMKPLMAFFVVSKQPKKQVSLVLDQAIAGCRLGLQNGVVSD